MKSNFFSGLTNIVVDDKKVEPPSPLPWYPNQLGWQFDAPRAALRNNPDIAKFHSFLMAETEAGNISRQEAVSMIPPLLLNVEPHHYVLDMCAAPGSKTAQIVEALHKNEAILPEGLVIANDADYKRSQMLVHQTSRLQSPCLVVTNHEAQFFPYVYFTAKVFNTVTLYNKTLTQSVRIQSDENVKVLQFDRILADVPCRRLQIAILHRGCQFLKIGGRIVYSTCTFNPGALVLEDVSSELPDLKRRPGITEWQIMDDEGAMHASYETVPEKHHRRISPSFFPPKNAKDLGLEKCLRVVPHDQNTGAFFVAVFKKVGEYGNLDKKSKEGETGIKTKSTASIDTIKSAEIVDESDAKLTVPAKRSPDTSEDTKSMKKPKPDAETSGADDGAAADVETAAEDKKTVELKKKMVKGWAGRGEQPFIFVGADHPDIMSFVKFYGVDERFPLDQFVVRSDVIPFRTIYLVSVAVKRLLLASNANQLNIVNTGVRIFSRNSGNIDLKMGFPYRLACEGIQTLAPYLSPEKIIPVTPSDLMVLLENEYPKFSEFSEPMVKAAEARELGCLVLKFTPTKETLQAGSLQEVTYFPVWRAGVSMSLLVPKAERQGFKARLTGKIYDTHRSKRGQNGEEVATGEGNEEKAAEVDEEGGALEQEGEEVEVKEDEAMEDA
ncbi:tRNA (cytosine(34)-C(5))-methyltransferase [Dinochytrium kinnereticum]|nr:tRNA (cytosine(34)-C(5))-methyltransferase [Dinochytrium kinnereticum]